MKNRGIRHEREFWQEQVRLWKESGTSQNEFCKERNISTSSLGRWSGIFRREQGQETINNARMQDLVEVFPPQRTGSSHSEYVEILVDSVIVRLHGNLVLPDRISKYIAAFRNTRR